jgi:predicted esterase
VIGFSQGATVALDLARAQPDLMSIVVSYSGQLASRLRSGERIGATIHLLHGGLDSVVPVEHARRALRDLLAVGVRATLDLTETGGHTIGQDMIILGTTRAMQSVFRGRRRMPSGMPKNTLH